MSSDTVANKRRSVSPLPAYQRIEADIREKVRDGRLPAGTMLANRHNLAREYGVALSTVQQAITNLIADGTLETFDRRGTFVARKDSLQENGTGTNSSLPQGMTNSQAIADLSRYLSASLPAEQTSATLGIVSTTRIEPETFPDTGSLWARLAMRSLEQVFAAAGGAAHYFDRYPDHLGPHERDENGFDDTNAIPIAEAIAALRGQGADTLAIIDLCNARDVSDEVVAAVDIEHVPIVYISWHEIRPPLAHIFYDNRFAGYQAAQHLLRKGYRRLIFLAPFMENWLTERIDGALDAVRHAGLSSEALMVYPDQPPYGAYRREWAPEAVYGIAQQACAEGRIFFGPETEPCGIIAPNDHTAVAVLQAAAERDKTAGADYGLIGFDDDPRAYSVGLTTVRPPIEAMGEEAGRLLLRALQGEKSRWQVRLRSHVISRASTSLRSRVMK